VCAYCVEPHRLNKGEIVTHRTRALLVAATALVAAVLPASAWAQSQLTATVGPGFTIFLRDASGSNVSHVPAGRYEILVSDRSPEHNFHLRGPGGVDQLTEVDFVGNVTWTVTLVDGIYTFQCDPHSTTMNGRFAVGTARLPPPPPPPPPPPARRGTLVATVGPGFTISLTFKGRRVKTLRAGLYMVMVRDRSRFHNFHLTGRGVNRKTGVGFRGMQHWNVRLQKGRTYRFVCDPHKRRMKGSFRVT
jgi:plastocyanin